MTTERWLTKKIRDAFRRISLRSFESCRIQSVPDLLAMRGGYSFWLEAKVMPRVDSPIPYRPGQLKWMREVECDGGKVFVICLLSSTHQIAIFRPPHALLFSLDATDPDWPKKVEDSLISSL